MAAKSFTTRQIFAEPTTILVLAYEAKRLGLKIIADNVKFYIFSLALQPSAGHGLLIHDDS
jgi:hypothetical protein